MNFFCENCNYTTTKKSDYNKHLLSNKHKINSQKFYICKECQKVYKVKSSYYYHVKKCNTDNFSDSDVKIELLKTKHELEKEKLKHEYEKKQNELLKDLIKNSTKTTQKALKITDKTISAIKYANEHFKNAPILTPINNFNMLNYDLNDENDKRLLIDTLLYHYRKNSVHKIFGDHIVGIYKKDRLEDQSMHTTDTSRTNYIVKIAKDNDNPKWYTDKNGLVICDVIIEKLINHYVELLKWYQKKLTDEMLLTPGIIQEDKQQKVENILGMLMEVDNGQLAKNTNRYIAPFFNLDK
jgi:uncharacterized C2H2 Zn-finger protein